MSDKKELKKAAGDADAELDELLDSALEDFTKKPEVSVAKSTADDGCGAVAATAAAKPDAEWTDEFIKQAAVQFESNIAGILGNMPGGDGIEITPEQIQTNFQRMAEAAAHVMSNPQSLEPTPQTNDFASTISQTLQNLSLGAENLQNPFSEQDIMNMFAGAGGLGAADAPQDTNAFLPFMQGMMQSLLSKEVLYPSLKDILDKFPAWLDDNKATLDDAEFQRYTKQKELMQSVCDELEAEKDEDEDALKKERFDRVLGLMQKMQDLGHPPTELVGETNPGLQFDPLGNPMLPPDLNAVDPNQCLLM